MIQFRYGAFVSSGADPRQSRDRASSIRLHRDRDLGRQVCFLFIY